MIPTVTKEELESPDCYILSKQAEIDFLNMCKTASPETLELVKRILKGGKLTITEANNIKDLITTQAFKDINAINNVTAKR